MSPAPKSAARNGGRKSPLRLAADPVPVIAAGAPWPSGSGWRTDRSPREMRQMMISEFCEWLRTQTNRHGRPFQPETISAYQDAAAALNAWMTSVGVQRPRRILQSWARACMSWRG